MLVMALLVALFVVIVVIARMVAGDGEGELTEARRAAIAEQIKPVGEVHVGSVPAAAPAAAQAAADPEQVYQQSCFACHGTGAAGAPKVGDKAAWADRIAQGKDVLYQHAINGKGAMPPKGGNASLSDDTVKAVVDFMVSKSR